LEGFGIETAGYALVTREPDAPEERVALDTLERGARLLRGWGATVAGSLKLPR
jgi:hypothetical protein